MATDGIDRMLAERAIRRRLLDYCRGIDRCDAGLVPHLGHPDRAQPGRVDSARMTQLFLKLKNSFTH